MVSHQYQYYVDNQLSLPLIVPYRNRLEHLVTFVPYMEAFMKGIKFHIMLIEQADEKPFNRGMLRNIGFTVANAYDNWICFHGVDMLPKDDSCDETEEILDCYYTFRT